MMNGRGVTTGAVRACGVLAALALSAGCMTGAGQRFSRNLAGAVSDQDDMALVSSALPAYILLIEAQLRERPKSEGMLMAAATLYNAYATTFDGDLARRHELSDKAMDYALRAVAVRRRKLPPLRECRYDAFEAVMGSLRRRDMPAWYTLGSTWAGWLRLRREDMTAAAELPRAEAIMKRIIEVDESYRDGGAHVYAGAMVGFLPPELGGRPNEARHHFERAIELSAGRNLMAKLMYAEHYARQRGDQERYIYLLGQIVDADGQRPGYTLMNTVAQQEAERLLLELEEEILSVVGENAGEPEGAEQ